MPLPIETPAVLVDLEIAKRNIERFQAYADEHGIRVRPHIKTHKLPQMADQFDNVTEGGNLMRMEAVA